VLTNLLHRSTILRNARQGKIRRDGTATLTLHPTSGIGAQIPGRTNHVDAQTFRIHHAPQPPLGRDRSRRKPWRNRDHRRHRAIQYRARAIDLAPRRAPASVRRASRYRAGLPARRRYRTGTVQGARTARSGDHANCLVGAFDSGQTTAIAQVAELKGIPLVINIAAAPPITEQGYKFVFRNFPTAPMILRDAFLNQKEVFEATGAAPKTVAFLHVNDTFGTAMAGAIGGLLPKFGMPYTIAQTIAYDPTARDLSVEITRARASKADALLVVSRINDAILLTRELVKQRWSPMGVLSMGPGWYEDQYLRTLGKIADGPLSFVPWYDPNKPMTKMLEDALAKAHPNVNLNTNHVYTFEAMLVAADAYKRAGSTNPKALADAIRATKLTNNVSPGPGIEFDEKGQNVGLKNSAVQNRAGKLLTVAPKTAANAKANWPMPGYDKRG
jgi:branched-chain amino acid transport system substrate-binding protein